MIVQYIMFGTRYALYTVYITIIGVTKMHAHAYELLIKYHTMMLNTCPAISDKLYHTMMIARLKKSQEQALKSTGNVLYLK